MPSPDTTWHRQPAEQHLRRLARRNGIKIHWLAPRPDWHYVSMAHGIIRTVDIPRPYNARQYLVALHELGHLLGPIPLRQSDEDPLVELEATPGQYALLAEAAAWGWALEHIAHDMHYRIEESDFAATLGRGLTKHGWSIWCAFDS